MGDYQALRVWREAHELTIQVYRISAGFPAAERFGLTSQIRRSAASIPANIAEGCGRNSDRDLAYFCRISLGSANELDYHLLLGRDLGFLSPSQYDVAHAQTGTVRRMLTVFVSRLARSPDSR
jgi:four helix bundle protein